MSCKYKWHSLNNMNILDHQFLYQKGWEECISMPKINNDILKYVVFPVITTGGHNYFSPNYLEINNQTSPQHTVILIYFVPKNLQSSAKIANKIASGVVVGGLAGVSWSFQVLGCHFILWVVLFFIISCPETFGGGGEGEAAYKSNKYINKYFSSRNLAK